MIREFPISKIFPLLEKDNLLPSIVFRSARRQCDQDLEFLAKMRKGRLDTAGQEKILLAVDKASKKHSLPDDVIRNHPHLPALLSTGVGAHHAGQLLPWRLLLEELMSLGELRLMLATGTVAAGVDFPARSVVITSHSRRDQEGFRAITASELQQMSGRAGRRGKDYVGFCLVAPSMFCDARVIHHVSHLPPEPLRSAYFAAPSTVLNLLKYRNVDDLKYTVERSLAAFIDEKHSARLHKMADEEAAKVETYSGDRKRKGERRVRRKRAEADFLKNRQAWLLEQTLTGLTDLGFLEGSTLSQKGLWAAELCTSLVLELAETINSGLLTERPKEIFVGLIASLAGDPHRKYLSIKKNPIPKADFLKLSQIVERVRQSYHNPAGQEVKVQPDAAVTVITWLESESWKDFSSLLRLAGVAEGDVARLVTQTADHLHQITKLKETFPALADQAYECRLSLLKPPFTDPEI
jgi:superfamily II RNA helicase